MIDYILSKGNVLLPKEAQKYLGTTAKPYNPVWRKFALMEVTYFQSIFYVYIISFTEGNHFSESRWMYLSIYMEIFLICQDPERSKKAISSTVDISDITKSNIVRSPQHGKKIRASD